MFGKLRVSLQTRSPVHDVKIKTVFKNKNYHESAIRKAILYSMYNRI